MICLKLTGWFKDLTVVKKILFVLSFIVIISGLIFGLLVLTGCLFLSDVSTHLRVLSNKEWAWDVEKMKFVLDKAYIASKNDIVKGLVSEKEFAELGASFARSEQCILAVKHSDPSRQKHSDRIEMKVRYKWRSNHENVERLAEGDGEFSATSEWVDNNWYKISIELYRKSCIHAMWVTCGSKAKPIGRKSGKSALFWNAETINKIVPNGWIWWKKQCVEFDVLDLYPGYFFEIY